MIKISIAFPNFVLFLQKSFNYHETRHSGIKPFKCEQCTKAYYTNKELIVHIRSHTGISKHAFRCQYSLLKYLFYFTTGEKPYVCNECGAAYTHADSLTNHRRLHTGERPFKCDFCPKSFIKSERLKRHRRIHTGTLELLSYVLYAFSKDFLCVLSFCLNNNLKFINCQLFFLGERPYACTYCESRFTQKYDCVKHERRHQEHQLQQAVVVN